MKKMFSWLTVVIALLLAFYACTDGMSDMPSGTLKQIVMTAPDFEPELRGRTNVSITDEGAEFTWATHDTVGIYPTEGAQAFFPMASGAGTKTASFTGGGWALKDGVTYAAYYPFIGKFYMDKNAIPVDYANQTQKGDASTDHIASYDYMAAIPATPQNGSVAFEFKHLGALLQLKLAIPEPTTINSVTLKTDYDDFISKGEVDIMVDDASITSVTLTDELTLRVENVSTTEASQIITLYMMISPTDLSGQVLKALVSTSDGEREVTLESKNFEAGKIYALGNVNDDTVDAESHSAVINENAEIIDETFTSYVIDAVETSSIIVSSSMPEELLPEVGEIILCGVEDEKFPYGFVGKVIEIRQDAVGYVIETEQPELNEIFESVNMKGEIPLEFVSEAEGRGVADKLADISTMGINGTIHRYEDGDGFHGISVGIETNLGLCEEFTSGNKGSSELSVKYTGSCEADFGFKLFYEWVENVEGKADCFDFKLDVLQNIETNASIDFEGEIDFKKELYNPKTKPAKISLSNCYKKEKKDSRVAPLVGKVVDKVIIPLFQPEFVISYRSNVSGKVCAGLGSSNSQVTQIAIHNNEFHKTISENVDQGMQFANVDIEGAVKAGFDFNLSLHPLWRKEKGNMLDLDFYAGPKVTGTAEASVGSENNICFKVIPLDLAFTGKFEIYSIYQNSGQPMFNFSFNEYKALGEQTRWLWPHYEDLKASFDSSDEKNISVSALLKDTTLFPLKVGFALYDHQENRLKNTEYKDYQFPPKDGYLFSDEFTEIDKTNIYYVRPTVEIMEETIDYEPKVKVDETEESNLRDALIKLYKSTNGDNWVYNENWCSELPIETWYGVSVGDDGYKIILNENNLTGKIEQSFPKEVQGLYCGYNQLTEVDVSGSSGLKNLGCHNNPITKLNVSNCRELVDINIFDIPSVEVLNASGCTALTGFQSYSYNNGGHLIKLDFSGCTALRYIRCDNNQLTALNVSGCTALIDLNCDNNQLTELDILECTALTSLRCGGNQLIALNVSGCTTLTDLRCEGNQLTALNVSGCTTLTDLRCEGNQLTALNVSGCTALTDLHCEGNRLTDLDFSGCTELTRLYCSNNQLTDLNVSECAALFYIVCENNQLTALNASGCTSLDNIELEGNTSSSLKVIGDFVKTFSINSDQLTSLDISECKALTSLGCGSNQLTVLNVSGCTALASITCNNSHLTELNASGCTSLDGISFDGLTSSSLKIIGDFLKNLYLYNTRLTDLNVSNSAFLKNVSLYYHASSSIKIVGGFIEGLDLSDTQLTSLDVSECRALNLIGVSGHTSSLKVKGNTFKSFSFGSNQLSSLDVSGCGALVELHCENGLLSSLDASRCGSLVDLYCQNSQLSSLDVSRCTALEVLKCENNQLTELNVSGYKALVHLDCSNNQLTNLNVSGCTALADLRCGNNQLTSLDASDSALLYLDCSNNKITSIIPDWVPQFNPDIPVMQGFYHDIRYEYFEVVVDGEKEIKYKDNGVGWWYFGEPQKGSHSR